MYNLPYARVSSVSCDVVEALVTPKYQNSTPSYDLTTSKNGYFGNLIFASSCPLFWYFGGSRTFPKPLILPTNHAMLLLFLSVILVLIGILSLFDHASPRRTLHDAGALAILNCEALSRVSGMTYCESAKSHTFLSFYYPSIFVFCPVFYTSSTLACAFYFVLLKVYPSHYLGILGYISTRNNSILAVRDPT